MMGTNIFCQQVADSLTEDPLSCYRVGQTQTARIVSKVNKVNKKRGYQWELSLKPSFVTGKLFDIVTI